MPSPTASGRTQDTEAGSNRLTRFIAGRRTAWVVALLPLLLAGFMFSLGEAEREEQTVDSLPAGFDITEATKMQEEATEGEDLVAIVLWTADEGEFTQAQVGELREYVGQAPLLVADDNTAAYTVRPVEDGDAAKVSDQVKDLRDELEESAPDGITAEVTGPAGLR